MMVADVADTKKKASLNDGKVLAEALGLKHSRVLQNQEKDKFYIDLPGKAGGYSQKAIGLVMAAVLNHKVHRADEEFDINFNYSNLSQPGYASKVEGKQLVVPALTVDFFLSKDQQGAKNMLLDAVDHWGGKYIGHIARDEDRQITGVFTAGKYKAAEATAHELTELSRVDKTRSGLLPMVGVSNTVFTR